MAKDRPACLFFRSRSPAQTRRLGRELARFAVRGQEYMLVGEYGCGKTQFVKGLAAGLGVKDARRCVTSPTFVLHGVYAGRLTLHHVDAHRLRTRADLAAIGWPDLFGDGVLAMEWADTVFPQYARLAGSLAPKTRVHGRSRRSICPSGSGGAPASAVRWATLDPTAICSVRSALRRICATAADAHRSGRPAPILVLFRHAGIRERLVTVTTGGTTD